MSGQPTYKPCERCGRPCMIGGNRSKILIVCRDCRWVDKEWLRLVGAA